MRETIRRGRDELVARIQAKLCLGTKKEADYLTNVLTSCVEETLLNNLDVNGFTMKLGSFGKFCVRHKHGTLRKIPFTGETKLTCDKRKIRFTSLGKLRERERVM